MQCVDVQSESLSVVKEELCSATKKPQPNKFCNKQPCPFRWKTGDWSQVSISCLIAILRISMKYLLELYTLHLSLAGIVFPFSEIP